MEKELAREFVKANCAVSVDVYEGFVHVKSPDLEWLGPRKEWGALVTWALNYT